MATWKIPLSDIQFGPEEKDAVQAVLDSGWLTMGGVTEAFENEFAGYVGARRAIAVTNGTAALHLAVLSLGIGPGDEVIVPSLTFVATANAVRYTGATPVFADIESLADPMISARTIEEKITQRTVAIMVVHYGGYAANLPAILALAEKYDLWVIEDAAHAPGTELDGKRIGAWGDLTCFSFFSNKNMTTGEGGMITTNDQHLGERLGRLRSHGMTTLTWDRHRGHAWSYDVVDLGYNYRIDEIRAALGRVQLQKLDKANERRRELTRHYHQLFSDRVPDISLPFRNYRGISSCHLLPILLPAGSDRTAFMERMKGHQIQTSLHYPPIHHFTNYLEKDGTTQVILPVTEDFTAREITLPLFTGMTDEQVEAVVDTVAQSIDVRQGLLDRQRSLSESSRG